MLKLKKGSGNYLSVTLSQFKVQCITSPLVVISEIHHGPSLIGYVYVNNNLLRSTCSASSLWIKQNTMLNSNVVVSYFQ